MAKLEYRIRVGFRTDTGHSRERNEDAYALYLPYEGEESTGALDAVFVVADGMGGHDAGDMASRFVADRIAAALTAEQPRAGDADVPGETLADWIGRVIRRVDRELRHFAREQGVAKSAGSTATVAAVQGSTILVTHVGDTRCYRLRGDQLEQLTQDHSWVAEQVRAGLLTPDEAVAHPKRNLLTQCLGIGQPPASEVSEFELAEGDRFLICTDGLHGVVADETVARVLMEEVEPQSAATRLVGLANEAGGPDNITVIVFDAEPVVAGIATTDPGRAPLYFETLAEGPVVAAPRSGNLLGRALLIAGVLLTVGAAALAAWHYYLAPGSGRSDEQTQAVTADSTRRLSGDSAQQPAARPPARVTTDSARAARSAADTIAPAPGRELQPGDRGATP